MSTQSVAVKTCCKCGVNLSGVKRMKDHAGQYWCVPCGQRDQARKAMATGSVCASCGEAADPSRITMVKGLPYCNFCLARRGKGKSSGSGFRLPSFSLPNLSLSDVFSSGDSNAGGNKKRLYLMIGLIAVLTVFSLWLNFH